MPRMLFGALLALLISLLAAPAMASIIRDPVAQCTATVLQDLGITAEQARTSRKTWVGAPITIEGRVYTLEPRGASVYSTCRMHEQWKVAEAERLAAAEEAKAAEAAEAEATETAAADEQAFDWRVLAEDLIRVGTIMGLTVLFVAFLAWIMARLERNDLRLPPLPELMLPQMRMPALRLPRVPVPQLPRWNFSGLGSMLTRLRVRLGSIRVGLPQWDFSFLRAQPDAGRVVFRPTTGRGFEMLDFRRTRAPRAVPAAALVDNEPPPEPSPDPEPEDEIVSLTSAPELAPEIAPVLPEVEGEEDLISVDLFEGVSVSDEHWPRFRPADDEACDDGNAMLANFRASLNRLGHDDEDEGAEAAPDIGTVTEPPPPAANEQTFRTPDDVQSALDRIRNIRFSDDDPEPELKQNTG